MYIDISRSSERTHHCDSVTYSKRRRTKHTTNIIHTSNNMTIIINNNILILTREHTCTTHRLLQSANNFEKNVRYCDNYILN